MDHFGLNMNRLSEYISNNILWINCKIVMKEKKNFLASNTITIDPYYYLPRLTISII